MPKKGQHSSTQRVRLGKNEWIGAQKLADDFNAKGAESGARFGVTMAIALNNARHVGLSMQLIGTNGRWYSYDLATPKVAHELDKRGMRTGKTLDLIDIGKPAPTKPLRNLRVVK